MICKLLKVFVLAALMTLVFAFGAWAGPVEPSDALKVAENWIDYVVKNDGSWGTYKTAEAAKIEPFFVEGELVGFVIDVSPMGFVLVPADDQLPPVKAYSTDSIFNQDAKGFAEWVGEELGEIIMVLRSESSKKPVFTPVNAANWRRLRDAVRSESAPSVAALPAPFLTTTNWDQGDPYNRFCPEWNGNICPVGCVATATAQVMRYWSWPPQGTGSHSYTSQTHRFQLTADFNHAYNWSDMPDSLNFATNSQKDEVARLSSDLGIAFNMDYDPNGSGAYTTDAYTVLPTYFYYSNLINYNGYSGDDDSWFNLFKTEIDAGRPALMSIRGGAGGHAVVCDGYRTDSGNMLHLNFGWGGWATAYYSHNNIAPGGNDFTWVSGQEIVRGIMPNEPQAAGAVSAATPMGGKVPVTVTFAGQGKKGVGPYTYSWDFGDGTTGQGQFTSHIFQQAGSYTVALTVTDTLGQTAGDSHLVISISSGSGLSAASSASTTSGQVPLAVTFTAVAQGGTPAYTYIWSFGDGSSETTTSATITHTYTVSGTYTAALTVKDSVGAQAPASGITIQANPATPRPAIQGVSKLSSPFRLKIIGSNFISGSKVKIDGVEVPSTIYKNASKLIAGSGAGLKNLCPKGVTVKVTVENEAGNISAEYPYTR